MQRAGYVLLITLILASMTLTQSPSNADTSVLGDHLTNEQLTVNGMTRDYLLFVPASYSSPGAVHGLALVFHGLTNTDASLVPYVMPTASARGLVVAFPQGLDNSWNAGACCGGARTFKIDDVGFATQLARTLSARFHPRSVVAAGFSNGAMLSWLLACQHNPIVAGIVDASGTEGVPQAGCVPSRPIIATAVHGLKDTMVPYAGGGDEWMRMMENAAPFRAITDVIDEWGTSHNHCTNSTLTDTPGWSATRWTSCAGGSTVTLWTIYGMHHEVPNYGAGEPVDFGSVIADTAARAR